MDRETLDAFAHLARTFARKEVRNMVGRDTRDGDLALLPSLLEKALETGLMTSPDPHSPGHELGVWGRACLTEGPTASLVILEEMARECAGVALCLHAAGLGALELDEPIFKRPALAFFPRNQRLTWEFLDGEEEVAPGPFTVLAPPQWDGLVIYRPSPRGWTAHVLERQEVSWEDLTPRTGLIASGIIQVHSENPGVQIPGTRSPRVLLRRHLLGLTAIGVGNALGALATAEEYAAQRYQGGAAIDSHAAVRLLLGEARAWLTGVRNQLYMAAQEDRDTREALERSMVLAVKGTEHAWRATSHALQVLGGYGYMEDYRLEKRLRDAMTLKTLPPSARDLTLMLGHRERRERT